MHGERGSRVSGFWHTPAADLPNGGGRIAPFLPFPFGIRQTRFPDASAERCLSLRPTGTQPKTAANPGRLSAGRAPRNVRP